METLRIDLNCITEVILVGNYANGRFSFLEENNLSGKAIVPFCTHEGSALGKA